MSLGRCFASAVLSPVHAVGHQFQGSAVNDVNGHLEAKGWPASFAFGKARGLLLQMIQLPPEQFLGHLGGPLSVGMGQPVATRWSRSANSRERSGMQLERVAQVVESNAMGDRKSTRLNSSHITI